MGLPRKTARSEASFTRPRCSAAIDNLSIFNDHVIMHIIEEKSCGIDPELMALCKRAYGGDNEARGMLEANALAGNSNAIALLKISQVKTEPIYPIDRGNFCKRYGYVLSRLSKNAP